MMSKFGESGRGVFNNTDGPIHGIEMTHPRGTAEEAAKLDELQANRDAKNAERTAQIEKWKNIGKTVLATLAVAGAGAALIFSGKEKIPGERLSQAEWENAMKNATSGYHEVSLDYQEDDESSISFVDKQGNEQIYYLLSDTDNNSYIDKGYASGKNGSADFDMTDSGNLGTTVKGAVDLLNEKMN